MTKDEERFLIIQGKNHCCEFDVDVFETEWHESSNSMYDDTGPIELYYDEWNEQIMIIRRETTEKPGSSKMWYENVAIRNQFYVADFGLYMVFEWNGSSLLRN